MNEDPTEKLIRNLQEENDKLKKMLESGGVTLTDLSSEETAGMSDAGRGVYRLFEMYYRFNLDLQCIPFPMSITCKDEDIIRTDSLSLDLA